MKMYITDVKPGKQHEQKPWTVKVLVLQKTGILKGTKTDYQRLFFADEKGNQIQATIFGESEIKHWKDYFLPNHHYYVSNASVKALEQTYRVTSVETQWVINTKTIVEKCSPDAGGFSNTSTYTPMLDVIQHLDSPLALDVIGIVAAVNLPREIKRETGISILQEFVMLDEQWFPVLLTMWNDFVTNEGKQITDACQKGFPVIAAQKVKAVAYKTFSLATRNGSGVTLEPHVPRAEVLRIWTRENTKIIPKVVSKESMKLHSLNLPWIKVPHLITINDIVEIHGKVTAWTVASIMVPNGSQRFYYTVCDNCDNIIAAECGIAFICSFCRHRSIAAPRCRFEVQVSDLTGSITAQVFGDVAEKHFQLTAQDIASEEKKMGVFDSGQRELFFSKTKHMVQLRIIDSSTAYGNSKRYLINNIQSVEPSKNGNREAMLEKMLKKARDTISLGDAESSNVARSPETPMQTPVTHASPVNVRCHTPPAVDLVFDSTNFQASEQMTEILPVKDKGTGKTTTSRLNSRKRMLFANEEAATVMIPQPNVVKTRQETKPVDKGTRQSKKKAVVAEEDDDPSPKTPDDVEVTISD